MPSKANLAIYQGDDYAAVVQVFDGNGSPLDLTDYQAHAHIRVGPANLYPEVVVEVIAAIQDSRIDLSIPATQTIGLSGQYMWDLQLVAPDGMITTILAGNAIVTPDVTREATQKQ
jgi:hypothetical protein